MPHRPARNLSCPARSRQGPCVPMLLALAVLLSACAPEGAEEPPAGEDPPLPRAGGVSPPPASSPGVPGVERPETMQGTLMLEGMAEPTTFRIFRTEPGFPLPFSTYLPDDVVPVEQRSATAAGVRFEPRFGGQTDPRAYLLVVVPDAAAREQVAAMAREATEAAEALPADDLPAWADAGWRTTEPGVAGRTLLGRHAGRWFYVLARYPAEMGDGMGPRVAAILEGWRWGDSGAGLDG